MARVRPDDGPPVYKFTPKHTAAVKLHFMSGVCFGPWCTLLWNSWRDIDWHLYFHRVLFLTFMSIVNSILAVPDWLLYRRRIASQALHPEPVFILGNPRTGTTHLHNLLALDPAFTHATTFQAGFPSSFITLERVGARGLLQPLLSPTRPMDAMKLTWDLPAEDEIAVTSLTGGASYYMPLVMPRRWRAMQPKLTWEAGARPQDFKAWSDALVWFFKKVTFRDCLVRPQQSHDKRDAPSAPRPMLIKSPVHTGRLRIWRVMFPRARYVFIYRHPVDVFRSSAHMVDTYFWYCYLQRPNDAQLTDYILEQYTTMYEAYMRERAHVPADQLVEVSFDELETNPLATLEKIYDTFGWGDRYQSLVPRFKQYCSTLSDFKKNQLNTLPADLEERVRSEWAPSFKQWGYK